jgi:hypothetical protein
MACESNYATLSSGLGETLIMRPGLEAKEEDIGRRREEVASVAQSVQDLMSALAAATDTKDESLGAVYTIICCFVVCPVIMYP